MEIRRGDGYRSFGAYLRSQRQLAQLTLRQLADLSSISNPYLSQIERGLHQPSVAVIRSIADALNLSADALLAQVAGLDDTEAAEASATTESAIRADPRLTRAQKSALLSVYRSMVGQAADAQRPRRSPGGPADPPDPDANPGPTHTSATKAAPASRGLEPGRGRRHDLRPPSRSTRSRPSRSRSQSDTQQRTRPARSRNKPSPTPHQVAPPPATAKPAKATRGRRPGGQAQCGPGEAECGPGDARRPYGTRAASSGPAKSGVHISKSGR